MSIKTLQSPDAILRSIKTVVDPFEYQQPARMVTIPVSLFKKLACEWMTKAYLPDNPFLWAGQGIGYSAALIIIRRVHQIEVRVAAEQKERTRAASQAEVEKRKVQFISPTQREEAQPGLSADRKVTVLRNALRSRNQIGFVDGNGNIVTNFIEIHSNSLKAAKRFFDANPALPVSTLLTIFDIALEQGQGADDVDEEEHDPSFYCKRSKSLSFFLLHVQNIADELGVTGEYDINQPTKDDWFPGSCEKEAGDEKDQE